MNSDIDYIENELRRTMSEGAQVPERVTQRIFRLRDGCIPEGWRFSQWLGRETNMLDGAWEDVVLCEIEAAG